MDVDHIDNTQLVLLSISNILVAVLCLPRFWAPQSAVLTTGPFTYERSGTVFLSRAEHVSPQLILLFIPLCVCMSCFVSRIFCIVIVLCIVIGV
jgi:hypothetical protein